MMDLIRGFTANGWASLRLSNRLSGSASHEENQSMRCDARHLIFAGWNGSSRLDASRLHQQEIEPTFRIAEEV